MNYKTITAMSGKGTGKTVDDLIVLSAQSDPFYMGTKGQRASAAWFAGYWQQFGYHGGVHLRRIHYQLVSQSPVAVLPAGMPYENTQRCWDWLIRAATAARYLGLVAPDALVDHRNPAPHLYLPDAPEGDPHIVIEQAYQLGYKSALLEFPDLPDLPKGDVEGYEGQQRYHVEVWAETSTMNDVLLPLCRDRFQCNLMTGAGALSLTQLGEAGQRFAASGKPARVLYLSDFHPAGEAMPVSAARKLEWFARGEKSPLRDRLSDADVQLFPLALTKDQCVEYGLPRTPIQDGELRAPQFERMHGTGATELDALEALHPGALGEIVNAALSAYCDDTLDGRVMTARSEVIAEIEQIRQAVEESHADALSEIEGEYERLRDEYAPRLEALDTKVRAEWEAIGGELELALSAVDLSAWPIPEGKIAQEIGPALYDSRRSYFEQLAAFKAHQGTSNGGENGDTEEP